MTGTATLHLLYMRPITAIMGSGKEEKCMTDVMLPGDLSIQSLSNLI